jgi:hypothetical protein
MFSRWEANAPSIKSHNFETGLKKANSAIELKPNWLYKYEKLFGKSDVVSENQKTRKPENQKTNLAIFLR